MNQTIKRKNAGFTLIELMVVVTLSVMLMLAASALFLTFLLGSTRVNRQQLIKEEGDYAMSQMQFLLRNAVELETNNEGTVCQQGMDSISFTSIDNGTTTLFAEEDSSDNVTKIASNSGIYLTSGDVNLIDGPTFNCSESSDRVAQYVEMRFTLRKGTPSIDEERDIVEQEFVSGAAIRTH